jgi:hypothetical protein
MTWTAWAESQKQTGPAPVSARKAAHLKLSLASDTLDCPQRRTLPVPYANIVHAVEATVIPYLPQRRALHSPLPRRTLLSHATCRG